MRITIIDLITQFNSDPLTARLKFSWRRRNIKLD